jgi:hypothetical protein
MAGAIQAALSNMVPQGPVMYLDAGNPSSYSGSGTAWDDLTVNNTDATLIASPAYTSGAGGYFTFNGTTQFATVAGSPMNTTAYSKCVWFQIATTATDNNLLSSNTGGHFMFFGAGRSNMYCGHTAWTNPITSFPSVTTFVINTWYFACLTFSTAAGMTLFVNGAFDSTYTAQTTAPTGGQMLLAAFQDLGGTPGNALSGRIAQAWVYNRVITSTEQSVLFSQTRGLYGV